MKKIRVSPRLSYQEAVNKFLMYNEDVKYNSSWMMGYDVVLTWVLAKWSHLPFSKIVNGEVTARYRGTIDLITSNFFVRAAVVVVIVASRTKLALVLSRPIQTSAPRESRYA